MEERQNTEGKTPAYKSPSLGRGSVSGKQPLVHSPLGQRMGVFPGSVAHTPSQQQSTPPYYYSEYESLWREAEDRAAALALELKFLKEKEEKSLEEIATQKQYLRKAAAEVRTEVLTMRAALEEKEKELERTISEANEAQMTKLELQEELSKSQLDVQNLEEALMDREALLEKEKSRLSELERLEKKGENASASSSAMYSKQVETLETSLVELSQKLKDLSAAEMEEPYAPQEMKSNHIWQQATNAAKARSRGQRAAAFAGQAKAEARVSSLQRELDSQLRRNITLEKELQIAKVKSFSNEEKLEREGKNLVTLSQELEGVSKKFHEAEALYTNLKDNSENFQAFITQTKELASSLLSEIKPIQTEDSEYLDSDGASGESESEDDDTSDKAEHAKAFSLLASAVRKSKAAMKYVKASNRAQLQAREVALNEVQERARNERETHKREKIELMATISDLENSNKELSNNVRELDSLLETSTSEKEDSLTSVQQELDLSKKRILDLIEMSDEMKEEKTALERKLFSLERERKKDKKSLLEKLDLKEQKLRESIKVASLKEEAATALHRESKHLSDVLAEEKESKEREIAELKKENMRITKENIQLQVSQY